MRSIGGLGATGAAAVLVVCGLAAFCGCQAVPITEPEVDAIVAVVKALYGESEVGRTIFVGTGCQENPIIRKARPILQQELATKVLDLSDRAFSDSLPLLTPIDPETGETGVTVALGGFSVDEQGRLRVKASFVRDSGKQRGCVECVLEHAAEGWSIVAMADTRPDCVAIGEVFPTYDMIQARVLEEGCHGPFGLFGPDRALFVSVGICGQWLFVIESTGFTATWSYYDSETGQIVAVRKTDDVGLDYFLFGDVACEDYEVAERHLCIE